MLPLSRIAFEFPAAGTLAIEPRPAPPSVGPIALAYGRVTEAFEASVTGGELVPALAWKEDPSGLFAPLRLREDAEYFVAVRVADDMAAARAAAAVNPSWPFRSSSLGSVLTLLPASTWRFEGAGTTVFGSLRFASTVGVVDLGVTHGEAFPAEVVAAKLEYESEFARMVSDVADEASDLVFELERATGSPAATDPSAAASNAALMFHLRRLMGEDQLPPAFEEIIRDPYSKLVSEEHRPPTAAARDPDLPAVAMKAAQLPYAPGGPLRELFYGRTPERLIERRRYDSVDIAENRFVKAFITELQQLCRDLQVALLPHYPNTASQLGIWADTLDEVLDAPLWREVGRQTSAPATSPVLLRRDAYRKVWDAAVAIREGLVVPWERLLEITTTLGDIRPVFELYEYWCFFVLRRVLRSVCGPEDPSHSTAYSYGSGGVRLELRQGIRSRLHFNDSSTGRTVKLFYNRRFRRPTGAFGAAASYSTGLRPDFGIEIRDGTEGRWIHLDAKYRLDMAAWLAQFDAEADDEPPSSTTFKKADLYKMHTYRDAIIATAGSYVLFPGSGAASVFVRHPDPAYRIAHALPSVGAFPLRPGGPADQEVQLANFLRQVLDEVQLP